MDSGECMYPLQKDLIQVFRRIVAVRGSYTEQHNCVAFVDLDGPTEQRCGLCRSRGEDVGRQRLELEGKQANFLYDSPLNGA